jgi:phage terminase large subunit-like protein
VPVKPVRANRGKWLRAEPVAALYGRGLVSHRPGLTALEDEMCAFGSDGLSDGHSPDRVDALVWALTELMLNEGPRPMVRSV